MRFVRIVCLASAIVLPWNVQQPLTVSAAVSLTDALEAIAGAYGRAGGGAVRFNFAGSNTLARQLANGAPADVFISADEAQMAVAANAGAIDAASRIDLLGNRLAVVVRRDSSTAALIRRPDDLLRPEVKRLALGDPAAVPAGVYARKYLEAAGVWSQLESKVVPVANVRAALTVVENGSAEAAIVYVTDVAVSSTVTSAFVIDGPNAPRIVYPAAIVAHSRQPDAARRFLSFLGGPEATSIFSRFGFTPLTPGR
jgi:molybdate transport system substrate-binding protein